jgi:putative transposase
LVPIEPPPAIVVSGADDTDVRASEPAAPSPAGTASGAGDMGGGDVAPAAPTPAEAASGVDDAAAGALRAAAVQRRSLAQPRGLSEAERREVLALLTQERFCDQSPAEVFATLLDEGRYLCSERTMYRILRGNDLVRERRNQLRHPAYAAPELMATRPNELWSRDITKLKTHVKCRYLHLYVLLDVFSRYVVGWLLSDHESGELAKALIEETYQREHVRPGTLGLHADNGAAMVSQPVAVLLANLGVRKSHSRPHVSDDNPFSEAQFKTLKYRPDFPERFASLQEAREYLRRFFDWYNTQRHHEGLAMLTPADVHQGRVEERLAQRARVLDAAYAEHPERFVHRAPVPARPSATVWINPPRMEAPSLKAAA